MAQWAATREDSVVVEQVCTLRCNLKLVEYRGGFGGRAGSSDWFSVSAGTQRLHILNTPYREDMIPARFQTSAEHSVSRC